MKTIKIIKVVNLAFFISLIVTPITFATPNLKIEADLEIITKKISEVYQEADHELLQKPYNKFAELNYSEEDWKTVMGRLKINIWPHQSPKEAVGGHLFYPPDINELWDYSYLNHFLKRNDILWSLAISAKYKNPLSRYYLAWALDNINPDLKYGSEGRLPFIQNLYLESFSLLEQSYKSSPEACYILGINHADYSWRIGIKNPDFLKAFKYHEKGAELGDFRNKLAALETRRIYTRIFKESPKVEDYMSLAKEGYMPAYLALSRFQENNDERIKLLKSSIEKKFPHGFIELGDFYRSKDDKEQALKYYSELLSFKEKKGEQSEYDFPKKVVAVASFKKVEIILGNLVLNSDLRVALQEASQEIKLGDKINKNSPLKIAEKILKEGVDIFKDPQACEQLIILYKILSDSILSDCKIKKSSSCRFKEYLKKGKELGVTDYFGNYEKENEPNPRDQIILEITKFLST